MVGGNSEDDTPTTPRSQRKTVLNKPPEPPQPPPAALKEKHKSKVLKQTCTPPPPSLQSYGQSRGHTPDKPSPELDVNSKQFSPQKFLDSLRLAHLGPASVSQSLADVFIPRQDSHPTTAPTTSTIASTTNSSKEITPPPVPPTTRGKSTHVETGQSHVLARRVLTSPTSAFVPVVQASTSSLLGKATVPSSVTLHSFAHPVNEMKDSVDGNDLSPESLRTPSTTSTTIATTSSGWGGDDSKSTLNEAALRAHADAIISKHAASTTHTTSSSTRVVDKVLNRSASWEGVTGEEVGAGGEKEGKFDKYWDPYSALEQHMDYAGELAAVEDSMRAYERQYNLSLDNADGDEEGGGDNTYYEGEGSHNTYSDGDGAYNTYCEGEGAYNTYCEGEGAYNTYSEAGGEIDVCEVVPDGHSDGGEDQDESWTYRDDECDDMGEDDVCDGESDVNEGDGEEGGEGVWRDVGGQWSDCGSSGMGENDSEHDGGGEEEEEGGAKEVNHSDCSDNSGAGGNDESVTDRGVVDIPEGLDVSHALAMAESILSKYDLRLETEANGCTVRTDRGVESVEGISEWNGEDKSESYTDNLMDTMKDISENRPATSHYSDEVWPYEMRYTMYMYIYV